MGPFPHDAPPAAISEENPMGTDGFEFVEFCHPDPQALDRLFKVMGFSVVAKHRSKNVTLYRQGDINFIVNAQPGSFAERFAAQHGPSAPAMAFRVADARYAYDRALSMGAKPIETQIGPNELEILGIEGIGGLQIYFVDRYGAKGSIYDVDFEWLGEPDPKPKGVGLYYIDHLTHNVYRGRLNEWAGFYERLFNFRQIRYFDIEGKLTGLHSRAMTSPDGKIRIPINEDAGETGQIEEYLQEYKGEGIQHVALGSHDLYESIEALIEVGARVHAGAERDLLFARRQAPAEPRGAHGAASEKRHPYRWGRGRRRRLHEGAAPALRQDRHRPDLLRIHPAQGRRRIRRRQLQGPLRIHRRGPDSSRRDRSEGRLRPFQATIRKGRARPGLFSRLPAGECSRI